jgi:hypothetical protein
LTIACLSIKVITMKNIFVKTVLTSVFLSISVGQSFADEIKPRVVQPQPSVPADQTNIPPSTPPTNIELPNLGDDQFPCWWWCDEGIPNRQDVISNPQKPADPEQLNENLEQQQPRTIQQLENSQDLRSLPRR